MTKLLVISEYINRMERYQKGDEIEVDPLHAEFLMNDAPGCFKVKGLEAPPAHKAILTPDYKKMTVPQLKIELAARGLPQVGKKAELVKRLEDYEK